MANMKNSMLVFIGLLMIQLVHAQVETADNWIEKGKTAYSTESYEVAAEYFTKASEVSPAMVEPWFRLGITYIQLTKYKKAKKNFLAALAVDATNWDCWNDLGFTYNRMGKYKKAIPCFEKTIELVPDIPNPYAHLGYSYLRMDNLAMTKKNLDLSSTHSKDYNKFYFYQACYHSVLNQTDKAIDSLEIAIEKGFKDKKWMESEKSLKFIRNDPRFKALLDAI